LQNRSVNLLTDPREFDILKSIPGWWGNRMQFDQLKRREVITLLGGAAAAWPLAARAQKAGKLPTIGLLTAGAPPTHGRWVNTFVQRLHELGWIDGRTIAIQYRWAEGRNDRYAEIAAEFVRLKVDVIVTQGGAVAAAKKATSVIPIVFTVAADPLGSGLVVAAVYRSCRQETRTLARDCLSSRPFGNHGQFRLSRRHTGDGGG
jgi:hypothetical protein